MNAGLCLTGGRYLRQIAWNLIFDQVCFDAIVWEGLRALHAVEFQHLRVCSSVVLKPLVVVKLWGVSNGLR